MTYRDSCMYLCDAHIELFGYRCGGCPQEPFIKKHREAWGVPNAPERAIRTLIIGLAQLCDAYQKRYDSPIGDDGYAGEYAADIAKSLNYLLGGVDTGRFDCGMLSSLIGAIAERANLDLET